MSSPVSTFLVPLAGGVCIGLASLLAMLATGKVPGISGMVSRVLRPRKADTAWRVVFLLGLMVGAAAAMAWSEDAAVFRPDRPLAWFIVSGALVGFGTRLGGGCTSGHGVCGIGMGSKSALVATILFMGVAMVTVYVVHHGPWEVLP